ncbi:MAG: hypothetical protein K8T20_13340 [Planctomycetes bacterium]|nr:hypothetical protein [Planctomycetota bacterium]
MPRVIDFFCTQCGKRIGLAERPPGGQAQCPFCQGITLVPAAGAPAAWPSGQGGLEAYWIDKQLVVPRGAFLPRTACSICAGGEGVELVSKKFQYSPPHASLLGVIGMLLMRKTEVLGIPLCRACARRWTTATWGYPALIVAGVLFFPILGGIIGATLGNDEAMAIGVFAGFAVWIAGMIVGRYAWIGKRTLICKHIDEAGVHLALPDAKLIQDAWTKNA